MIHPAIPLSLLALAAPAARLQDGRPPEMRPQETRPQKTGRLDGISLAQLSIHERIVIRIPRLSRPRAVGRVAIPVGTAWKEHKGPKCIAAVDVAGASVTRPGMVDLLMGDGQRLRARLDHDCKALDFYTDFYIRPAADGLVCADRDAIRLRSGTTCDIDTFRSLQPDH